MDQQRRYYFHSQPFIPSRATNTSTSNIRTVATASGNTTNLDSHYLPDAHDNAMMNRFTEYTGVRNQHNRDMDVSAAAHICYSGLNPSSDQFHGSSSSGVSGAYKRKSDESNRGNYQHSNASASSSTAPPNAVDSDGAGMMDNAPFSRHDHNHLIPGKCLGPHFQQAAAPWPEQPVNYNINDGQATAGNQSVPMPYFQVPHVNESSLEDASMGLPVYNDTASIRSGFRLHHPPLVNPLHHNFHSPTLPMQGMRGHSTGFYPSSASCRVSPNLHIMPPAGLRRYRYRRGVMPNATLGHQNHSPMHFVRVDDVAILLDHHRDMRLDIAPSAGLSRHQHRRRVMPNATLGHQNLSPMHFSRVDDVAVLVDHHRDMHLDIYEMSYEELLALSDQNGNVSTGLSEEIVTNQMKTKTYVVPATAINLEEVASEEQETDCCIICLDEYQNQEKIGILQCGHECHADCLRKWLVVKNVCPLCKSEGLILE